MRIMLAMIFGPLWVAYKVIEYFIKASFCSKKFIEWFRDRNKKKPGTHGNDDFADDKALKQRGHFENRGFLSIITSSGKKVFNHYERAVLMLAPPGSGKSQHFMAHIRAVLKRPEEKKPHLIIGDAAGELRANLAAEMEAAGYKWFVIDCVSPRRGSTYDVLSDLDPNLKNRDFFGKQLDAICNALIADDPNARNQHFTRFTRALVKCAILSNVMYGENDKPICDIIDELIDDDDREALLERAKSFDDKRLQSTLKIMSRMQTKEEGMSMISTCIEKLEGWSDDSVRKVSRNKVAAGMPYQRGWKMSQMLDYPEPIALFIRTGTQSAAGDYARMVYSNVVDAVSRKWDATEKPLSREVEFLMDEAGLTGNCSAIMHAYNRLRKAGVRIRMCFLSLSELKSTYPGWENLLAGSDIIAFGGSNEMQLNRLVSDLTGVRTIQNRSKSESQHGESTSYSEQAQQVAKPNQVRGAESDESIAVLGNIAVKGKKVWRFNKKTGLPESL